MSFSYADAQQVTVRGSVRDSSLPTGLKNASVVLLHAKDSFIVADARTGNDGAFEFKTLPDSADYILFLTYPKYAVHTRRINTQAAENGILDLGGINLVQKAKLLQEVIIKAQVAAIRIKGDTTEYAADSFKVQANGSVEDLLRRLPGLQVDQFGNITAHGQRVKKVLVDGEEFFSDDPTLVSRNLRADMIHKVQVFDKKSDAAAFTGIEDGVRDKTINLKLKEDKNNGVFGKVDLGTGTDGRFNAQGMLNFFKGKRKMAAFATAGNIGTTGLGTADKNRIGDEDQGSSTFSGKGLPRVVSGGLHFDNKWDADKSSINGNYKFSVMNIAGNESTVSQNNLPGSLILSEGTSDFSSNSTRNGANVKHVRKIDSTATVTIYADGSLLNSSIRNSAGTTNWRDDSSRIYDSRSGSHRKYSQNTYIFNGSWEKQLKKKGRTISLYLNSDFSNDTEKGENKYSSDFYNNTGLQDSSSLLHLKKSMNDNRQTAGLKTIYTEPLSKQVSMILNFGSRLENSRDDKRSFNLAEDPSGKRMDTAFSTRMNSINWYNEGGVNFNYTFKNGALKLGSNVKSAGLNIENVLDNMTVKKNFVNLAPNFNLDYKINAYNGFSIGYNGNGDNPQHWQLIPFAYNNSQLITFLPNLELKNSFTNSVNGRYYATKITSMVYWGGNASYSRTANPMAQAIQVSPSGAYVYQYVNMNGYSNQAYQLMMYYSRKINPADLQASAGMSLNGGKTFSLSNLSVNELNYNTYGLTVELFKSKPNKYSFYLVGTGSYTNNNFSLQLETNNNYFAFDLRPSVDVFFLKKFQLHADANYIWQQKTQTFSHNFDRMIFNAWIGRHFLKGDQLTVKVTCNDILNENNGYTRNATNTFFTENRYTTLRRFFMLGVTWNFTRFNYIKQ